MSRDIFELYSNKSLKSAKPIKNFSIENCDFNIEFKSELIDPNKRLRRAANPDKSNKNANR